MVDICHRASPDILPETPNNNLHTHTHTHTQGKKTHWSRALPGLKRSAKTWPSSYDHDHPHGHGWHLARWCACVCVCMLCVFCIMCAYVPASLHGSWLACLHVFICVSLCLCVCVCVSLAWRAMPQGAWAASEGPVCPQSLTICALLVVIKVSNLEVSWGLAKRGQKMSLRCSSCWAAVTIFTYLYTLIVFALLPWHWGSQSLEREGKKKGESEEGTVEDSVTHSQIEFSSKMNLN